MEIGMHLRAKAAIPGFVLSLALLAMAAATGAHAAELTRAHPAARPAEPVAHRLVQVAAAVQHRRLANLPRIRPQPSAPPVWTDTSGSWRQVGIASWYGGKRWQGRRTSSGARYDENLLTAAHATLPLGSRVRVVVPATGRSVVVTINDRPGTRTRIIDLSRAAAAKLGILRRGIAKVALLPD